MKRSSVVQKAALVLLAAILPSLSIAQKYVEIKARLETAVPPARIWSNPGNPAELDLFHGPGGKQHAPNPTGRFTFVRIEPSGASPKFDAEDQAGTLWRIKLGEESKSETAATRLLWAAGYFTDEIYYVPRIKVEGVPKQFLSPDGTVVGARLERRDKDAKKLGSWDWFKNPFDGTTELNGLRIMMSFLNNWDLKNMNNSIIQVGGEQRFLVSDVGATFGKTGGIGDRTKSLVRDYEASKFIKKTGPEHIDFVMHGRPFFLFIIDFYHYAQLTRREKVTKFIPREHAKWLGRRLGGLSGSQISDCFLAAGYSPMEVERYTIAVRKRIAELNTL